MTETLPDAACRAIVRQAVEWVLARLVRLPEACTLAQWPEYPVLLDAEHALNGACLTGDQAQTKDAARAYCVAWRAAIQQRRNTTGDLHE